MAAANRLGQMTLAQRLARYTAPPDANGCKLWTGAKDSHGYGQMSWQGSHRLVHRLAWIVWNGPIKDGMFICHECDVPACVNADHLWVGPHVANMADMVSKGRARSSNLKGEAHGCAKITNDNVMDIRASTQSQRAIAKQYGVSQTLVGFIRRREIWRHI